MPRSGHGKKLRTVPRPFINLTPRPPIPAAALRGEAYLTDGRRLFRVVSPLDPRQSHPSALLEDCRTLAVDPYSADELYGMGLRAVSQT